MMTDNERLDEERRVAAVTKHIGERIERLERDVLESKAEVVDIRKNFWSDITVNIERGDDRLETESGIRQQTMVLAERERSLAQAQTTLGKLERLRQSPYFGRVDFAEAGDNVAERLYIGLASFMDEKTQSYLVYDWRAPISSLFYDHTPGPAAYETPSGTIAGTMELKRQYVIRDGRIRYMFDTGVAIGDEMLQQALGQSADTHMRSIVATIQREQNAIIRDDRGKLLVVRGAAGSGKTSVALQRAAYLLYKYRGSLRADQMVLFSPNPLFNSYVSTVLPELGETNMQQTTLQEYLSYRLGGLLALEDPYTQLEYALTAMDEPGYAARMSGIRYKASAAFYQAMENYRSVLEREGMAFRDIAFRGRKLIAGERIAERFYAFEPNVRLSNRIVLLQEWLLEELAELEKVERKRKWVAEAIELLDKEEYQRAYAALRKKRGAAAETFDDAQRERAMLARFVVRDRFKPLRNDIKRLAFVDIPAIYRRLFTEPAVFAAISEGTAEPEQWEAICVQTAGKLERLELAYEDATPLLYLRELVEGVRTYTDIKYVMIDEGQDYSPFQFRYIKRLFPRAKLTVLGDWNQAIMAHHATAEAGTVGWELADAAGGGGSPERSDASEPGSAAFEALFGERDAQTFQLTKTYRSTKEIVAFTSRLLPHGAEIEPFNRSGEPPRIIIAATKDELADRIRQDIAALRASGIVSIAVVCKTAAETAEAYERLREGMTLHAVTKDTHAFVTGTQVIPVYLAKGVEFDAVIIYNASRERYGRESERKLFYTACTRAMHRLHIYAHGELTPFIAKLEQ